MSRLTVSYEYKVDGVTFFNNATLQGNINSAVGPGQTIQVKYLPTHPASSLCSLEDLDAPGNRNTNRGIGAFLGIIGTILIVCAAFGNTAARLFTKSPDITLILNGGVVDLRG